VVAIAAAGVEGCSSDTAPETGAPPDEITAEPFPSTVQLSSGDLSSLEPDPGDGTLAFKATPAALAGVHVGDIVVGGVSPSSPAGLLRAVLSVDKEGDRLVLKTAQAPIQLAYKKLHARFSRSAAVAAPGVATRSHVADLGSGDFDATKPFDYVLFDGDGDESTTNDQIVTDGSLGGGFDYSMSLDVDWGGIDALPDVVTNCIASFAKILSGEKPSCAIDDLLPEAKTTFVVDPKVHADVNVHGAAILEYEKEVDLASTTLTPVILGPLVFVPAVDLTAHLQGGASGAFQTGVHGSAVFETSVTVSSKQSQAPQFSPPVLKSTDFGRNDTRVTLHAEAKVGAGARLNVLLFGVTGPYANALAYGKIDADLLGAPCWSLRAGVEANLGLKVTSPALPFIGHVTLADWSSPTLTPFEVDVSSGACDAPPDAPNLPPGSGADASHYAAPSFTPWSRTFSSPVEGANAGSPGNSTVFADLQRTIDGHYVRAGWGVLDLVKTSEQGDVVWARELGFEGGRLVPLRVRPTNDGALLVASSAITAPIVLTKLAQDGTVLEARGYDVPTECTVGISALSPDGAGGHYVAGSCVGGPKSFLLHARADDATFALLDPGAANDTNVRVVESIGQDAFIAGAITDPTDAMFAMRIDPQNGVVWSKRYQGCESAPDAIPSAAIVGSQGEVTMAGSGGAQHNGMLMRLRPDGSVGFAKFPGFGFGAGSVFLLDSFAELPTTGYVAGGSVVRFTGTEIESVPGAALAGFDASGKLLWAKRYTFGEGGTYAAAGHVGVRLTDDGGVFASALVSDASDPLGGKLWAFKSFAKDGSIEFSPGGVDAQALAISDLDCALTASDHAMAVQPTTIAPRSVVVTSTPVQLASLKQTAQ
jgi:hypothetical protein